MSTYYKNTSPVFWGATTATKWYKEFAAGDVDPAATTIDVTIRQYGNITHFPPAVRNPALDHVFNCRMTGRDGLDQGIIVVTCSIDSDRISVPYLSTPVLIAITILGKYVEGAFFTGSVTGDTAIIDLAISMGFPDLITEAGKGNWIKWSNIGSLDFTIWKDNIAGERPMDWKGWIYAIKKLGNKVVVYGEGGVSMLVPTGTAFVLQTVYRIGLKGKQAVAGNESVHFFVDTKGQLFIFGEAVSKASLFEAASYPEKLDYSEYLANMTNPVLSWDELNSLLYICDGTTGYVYNPRDKSLGKGPANITGISSQGGTLYVAAPATITTPVFEICTDIYDFNTRRGKTIRNVQLGADITKTLSVALDYRRDKATVFSTTDWRPVNAQGIAFITCFGQEFRVKVKSSAYEYFELDYLMISGKIHDY